MKRYLKSLLIGELAPDQPSFESNKNVSVSNKEVSVLKSSSGNGLGFGIGGERKTKELAVCLSPCHRHGSMHCPTTTESIPGCEERAPEPQILLGSSHCNVSVSKLVSNLFSSAKAKPRSVDLMLIFIQRTL